MMNHLNKCTPYVLATLAFLSSESPDAVAGLVVGKSGDSSAQRVERDCSMSFAVRSEPRLASGERLVFKNDCVRLVDGQSREIYTIDEQGCASGIVHNRVTVPFCGDTTQLRGIVESNVCRAMKVRNGDVRLGRFIHLVNGDCISFFSPVLSGDVCKGYLCGQINVKNISPECLTGAGGGLGCGGGVGGGVGGGIGGDASLSSLFAVGGVFAAAAAQGGSKSTSHSTLPTNNQPVNSNNPIVQKPQEPGKPPENPSVPSTPKPNAIDEFRSLLNDKDKFVEFYSKFRSRIDPLVNEYVGNSDWDPNALGQLLLNDPAQGLDFYKKYQSELDSILSDYKASNLSDTQSVQSQQSQGLVSSPIDFNSFSAATFPTADESIISDQGRSASATISLTGLDEEALAEFRKSNGDMNLNITPYNEAFNGEAFSAFGETGLFAEGEPPKVEGGAPLIVSAVPESGALTLSVIGGLAALGFRRSRRNA